MRLRPRFFASYIAVSAARGWGIEQLLQRIEAILALDMDRISAFIPYRRNDLLALWHQRGVVDEERYEADGTFVVGKVPPALTDQFRAFLAPSEAPSSGAGVTEAR